jgi:hypothetical protein
MPLLNIFGELENFIADDLYPYRYVITPIVIVAIAAGLWAAYRLGVHLVLMRHKVATAVIGVPLLVATIVAGDYLVSPLWERSHLEEASPLAAETTTGDPGATSTPSADTTTDSDNGDTAASDDASPSNGSAASFALRFENFSVRNGPDLYVYISTDPTGGNVDEALNLGELKATDGAFNYELPADVDLSTIKSAVVWCRQFSVLFAHAEFGAD